MPRIPIRNNVTHYQESGRGPALILLHGLFCNIGFWWFHFAPLLAENHRVVAVDLRGHGLSGMPSDAYRAVDMAEDIVALMDRLALSEAHVVGHSFGGAVALALAAHHQNMVLKLTLADAWIPALQPLPRPKRSLTISPDLAGEGPNTPSSSNLQKEADRQLPKVIQSFLDELAETEAPLGDTPSDALARYCQDAAALVPSARIPRSLRQWHRLMTETTAAADVHDTSGLEHGVISEIEVPVDLVYGGLSRFQSSRDGLANALPRTRLATVPGAGHFFPFFRPRALYDAMESLQ